MTKIFARFMKDESGATAIEYGLIAALISVALITGATALGSQLNAAFNDLSTKMTTANGKY
jgi:pilus assembly protein Flp/PilA